MGELVFNGGLALLFIFLGRRTWQPAANGVTKFVAALFVALGIFFAIGLIASFARAFVPRVSVMPSPTLEPIAAIAPPTVAPTARPTATIPPPPTPTLTPDPSKVIDIRRFAIGTPEPPVCRTGNFWESSDFNPDCVTPTNDTINSKPWNDD